jgi:hypothetical protein
MNAAECRMYAAINDVKCLGIHRKNKLQNTFVTRKSEGKPRELETVLTARLLYTERTSKDLKLSSDKLPILKRESCLAMLKLSLLSNTEKIQR